MTPRLYTFVGGSSGPWKIRSIRAVLGETLPSVSRLRMDSGDSGDTLKESAWSLRGIVSNERYVERREKDKLVEASPAIGRPEAQYAALIPIRKNASWWTLTQNERREIFEEKSHHIKIGLKHTEGIARRLHHCRDLGENEPFDFLTWFEFPPSREKNFDELLKELRATTEWGFVEREVEIRLERDVP